MPVPTSVELFGPAVPRTVAAELRARTKPELRPLAIDPTDRSAEVFTFVQMVNVSFDPLIPLPLYAQYVPVAQFPTARAEVDSVVSVIPSSGHTTVVSLRAIPPGTASSAYSTSGWKSSDACATAGLKVAATSTATATLRIRFMMPPRQAGVDRVHTRVRAWVRP
ncbi:hypothetical protein AKG07_16715 [Microbacterium sp. CGR1]|nr:hypothetical protein AKG07_16715 [Microbacterium sp. CGR1]